ncbi:MAG: radical SAM protein [Candidatus Omnitrophica bacterium]|nr:radical SAM protein [Candidatus Omnitrophota bacterium]MDD5501501.1 radical SAM protein [Candidatus Omnitrophota bacterium]
MKVLLINPQSRAVQNSPFWQRSLLTPIIPLGLAYIAAVLEKNGIRVQIVDQVAEGLKEDSLLEIVKVMKPDVVGFSCLTAAMDTVVSLSAAIKALDRDIKIVLGNIHASVFAEVLLKKRVGDVVIHGEGDYTMLELVSRFEKGKGLEGMNGIAFMSNGSLYNNAKVIEVGDLDALPYPAYHLLDLKKYREVPLAGIYNKIAITISASRGCPFNCVFCSQNRIHGRPRYRKIESIIDEMEFMHERYNAKFFGFTDAFFPFSTRHGIEFCDALIKRGLHKKVKWVVETMVDFVTRDLAEKMKEAGLYMLEFGFESGSQKVLDRLGKNTDLEYSKKIMRITRKLGILTLGLFMIGLPGETVSDCDKTIQFAKELDCDFVKFNIATPYPGSKLFESYKDEVASLRNFSAVSSWYDWFCNSDREFCTVGSIGADVLRNIQRKAMFSFYFRPSKIAKSILKRRISLKFMFFGALTLLTGYWRMFVSGCKKRTVNPDGKE